MKLDVEKKPHIAAAAIVPAKNVFFRMGILRETEF